MKNKKILAEIIVIPLCVLYLIFTLLKSSLAAGIIGLVFVLFTAIWFSPKYIDEVYVYKNKKNLLKLLVAISDILLFVFGILMLIFKLKVYKVIFLIFLVICLLHLVYFFIKNIKEVIKKEKEIGINILYSFFSLLLFVIILSTFVIYLK